MAERTSGNDALKGPFGFASGDRHILGTKYPHAHLSFLPVPCVSTTYDGPIVWYESRPPSRLAEMHLLCAVVRTDRTSHTA